MASGQIITIAVLVILMFVGVYYLYIQIKTIRHHRNEIIRRANKDLVPGEKPITTASGALIKTIARKKLQIEDEGPPQTILEWVGEHLDDREHILALPGIIITYKIVYTIGTILDGSSKETPEEKYPKIDDQLTKIIVANANADLKKYEKSLGIEITNIDGKPEPKAKHTVADEDVELGDL